MIQAWKIQVAFKSCFNLTGVKRSERRSRACQVRFELALRLAPDPKLRLFLQDWWLPGSPCGLRGVESIHVTLSRLQKASRQFWVAWWEMGSEDASASTFRPCASWRSSRDWNEPCGFFPLTTLSRALPHWAFPYRSPYCQNSAEEPWCDGSWSSSWELSENSLISFECFGLHKPRNPNRTLEVTQ